MVSLIIETIFYLSRTRSRSGGRGAHSAPPVRCMVDYGANLAGHFVLAEDGVRLARCGGVAHLDVQVHCP